MRILAAALLLFASSTQAAVPPAPIAIQSENIARSMAAALESNDAVKYRELLANDLNVWIDGKQVAADRSEWLSQFQRKLTTKGVRFKTGRALASNLNFILITHVDTRGSFEPGKQDCCQAYEVSQYEVRNGMVVAIRVLSTGAHDLTLTSAR